MAKVAVLVPSQELCNLAQPLVGTFPSITLMTLEYIKTSQAESRARELERQGCDLRSWPAVCRLGSSSRASSCRWSRSV